MCNICINSLIFISRDLNKLKELTPILRRPHNNARYKI